MKKRIICGLIVIGMLMALSGCGKREEKISDKSFQKILTMYWAYFEAAYDDDCAAKIVVGKDGVPMMMVHYEDERGDVYNVLYGYEKGGIKHIYKSPRNTLLAVYSDNIMAEFHVGEVNGINNETTDIDLFILEEEPVKIGTIDPVNKKIYISYKGKVISMEETDNELVYKAFVDEIYEVVYGKSIKPNVAAYQCNIFLLSNFFRSAPLMYNDDNGVFDSEIFRKEVTALMAEGSMTQEEYILWDIAFYDEMGWIGKDARNTIRHMNEMKEEMLHDGPYQQAILCFESIIARNPNLFDKLDDAIKIKYMRFYKETLLLHMMEGNDASWMKEVNILKEMSDKELREILMNFMYEATGESMSAAILFADGDKSQAEYIDYRWNGREYISQYVEEKISLGAEVVLMNRSGKEMFEAFLNLVANLKTQMIKYANDIREEDEYYVEAYKALVEKFESYGGLVDSRYTDEYVLCRAGEDNTLCLLVCSHIEGENLGVERHLYVYNGKGRFTTELMSQERTSFYWSDEINGWYISGSGGASTQLIELITIENSEIDIIFEGYYNGSDRMYYYKTENDNRIEIEEEEFVRPLEAIMGDYLDEYMRKHYEGIDKEVGVAAVWALADYLSEKNAAAGINYYLMDYYSTVEEAYEALLKAEGN